MQKTIGLLNKLIRFSAAILLALMVGLTLVTTIRADAKTSLWFKVDSLEKSSRINASVFLLDKEELSYRLGGSKQKQKNKTVWLPLPQGGGVNVAATPTQVMAPELAKQYPDIQTWKVIGEDDRSIHGRIDLTKQGFHAMLIMPDGDTVYIEPDNDSAQQQYLSFSKRSNQAQFKHDFSCGVNQSSSTAMIKSHNQTLARPASRKIIYRLAVAATGEYTQYHGGSKASALSAIVTTINRVNEIYEQDLGVEFILVAQQTDIIYTNPDTDPYTKNDVNAMLDENLLNLSDAGDLSKSLYDIGHLLGAGEVGGLASVSSVCNPLLKAAGVTGVPNPKGDAFYIDYVAHELGHQLGATHTFNSQCGVGNQREPTTAVEPGSGSTVMSYAGVCGDNNLQLHTDPQFHARSIVQISDNIRNNNNQCGSRQAQSNQNPDVDAGANAIVPVLTPIMLKATGSDSDGDNLNYTWEQNDIGTSTDLNVDVGDNALFRSYPAIRSPIRYIPRLSDLFNKLESDGEPLIVSPRSVKFVVTARDGKGGVQSDEVIRQFVSTGDLFQVSSHKNAETLFKGETTRVSWRVAGTDSAPINCQNINIALLESNGNTIILNTSKNDGDELVFIPENSEFMNNARIMVSCANNTFFNISSGRLKVSSRDNGDSGGGALFYILLPLFIVRIFRKKLVK